MAGRGPGRCGGGAGLRPDPQGSGASQRTPPIRRLIGRIRTIRTSPAPSVTPAIQPNSTGSGTVSLRPAANPASLLPAPIDRNQTPIIRPTTRCGASLVTTLL